MSRIKGIKKQTQNSFLNLYELETVRRNGKTAPYYVASRAETEDKLKARSPFGGPDGVIIYGIYGEKKDRVVLVRQFRYAINGYIYEFPAGLVENGENAGEAASREMFEETGLTFAPRKTAEAYGKPFYTTVGMTDECCATVYGYCTGTPTGDYQEESEDIQVVLADREECKRILREENVAIMCAYMLMHFIHCGEEDPLNFLDDIRRA